jgi:hypothetical protein
MSGILLVLAMYVTPAAMTDDKPELFTKGFDSLEECEAYKEKHVEMLNNALQDGLLAYSIKCTKV